MHNAGCYPCRGLLTFKYDGVGGVGRWVMVGAKDIPERGWSAYDRDSLQ